MIKYNANFSKRDGQILPNRPTQHLLRSVLARKIKSLQASVTKCHFGILKQETEEHVT